MRVNLNPSGSQTAANASVESGWDTPDDDAVCGGGCSGHGTCSSPPNCTCVTGYTGATCNRMDVVWGPNLVPNPSFERMDDMREVAAWFPYRSGFQLSTSVRHHGAQAMTVVLQGGTGNAGGAGVYVHVGQTSAWPLKVGAWSRAVGVTLGNSPEYALFLDVRYASGAMEFGARAQFHPASSEYHEASFVFNPQHPVEGVWVYLVFSNLQGVAHFDSVSVTEAVHVGGAQPPPTPSAVLCHGCASGTAGHCRVKASSQCVPFLIAQDRVCPPSADQCSEWSHRHRVATGIYLRGPTQSAFQATYESRLLAALAKLLPTDAANVRITSGYGVNMDSAADALAGGFVDDRRRRLLRSSFQHAPSVSLHPHASPLSPLPHAVVLPPGQHDILMPTLSQDSARTASGVEQPQQGQLPRRLGAGGGAGEGKVVSAAAPTAGSGEESNREDPRPHYHRRHARSLAVAPPPSLGQPGQVPALGDYGNIGVKAVAVVVLDSSVAAATLSPRVAAIIQDGSLAFELGMDPSDVFLAHGVGTTTPTPQAIESTGPVDGPSTNDSVWVIVLGCVGAAVVFAVVAMFIMRRRAEADTNGTTLTAIDSKASMNMESSDRGMDSTTRGGSPHRVPSNDNLDMLPNPNRSAVTVTATDSNNSGPAPHLRSTPSSNRLRAHRSSAASRRSAHPFSALSQSDSEGDSSDYDDDNGDNYNNGGRQNNDRPMSVHSARSGRSLHSRASARNMFMAAEARPSGGSRMNRGTASAADLLAALRDRDRQPGNGGDADGDSGWGVRRGPRSVDRAYPPKRTASARRFGGGLHDTRSVGAQPSGGGDDDWLANYVRNGPRRSAARSRASSIASSINGSVSGRSRTGSRAGSRAGSHAGSRAGSHAGSRAGSHAGSRAGSRAGSVRGDAPQWGTAALVSRLSTVPSEREQSRQTSMRTGSGVGGEDGGLEAAGMPFGSGGGLGSLGADSMDEALFEAAR